jgi:Ser/Thr protein kinase RdoA (MazF antagonist)
MRATESRIGRRTVGVEAQIAAVVAAHWGVTGELSELDRGSTARAWRVDAASGPLVARLTSFPLTHVEVSQRIAELVDDAGIPSGRPRRTTDDRLVVDLGDDGRLSLLEHIPGRMMTIDEIDVAALGRLLGRVHVAIAELRMPGAWTIPDAVDHLRAGLLPDHPDWVRPFVESCLADLDAWVPEREQLTRGDGPAVWMHDGAFTGLIDWGATRWTSVADDIGIWTVHLGPLPTLGGYDAVVRTFVDAYRTAAPLTAHEEAGIRVFQGLRLADRMPYVSDPAELARLKTWIDGWLAAT